MTMKTKVPFIFNLKNIHDILVGNGITMRLECISPSISKLYFINDISLQVAIPDGIAVYDNTNKIDVKPLPGNSGTKFFILCYSDNYIISMNGRIILELSNKHQWELRF